MLTFLSVIKSSYANSVILASRTRDKKGKRYPHAIIATRYRINVTFINAPRDIELERIANTIVYRFLDSRLMFVAKQII